MKIDMFNIDDFVELNHCQEVTNPIFWQANKLPTDDGLFSYEIFGSTEEDRKNRYAYIDLKGNYLHPIVYGMLSSRMGSLKDVVSGNRSAIIDPNGKIKVVPDNTPGAGSGLQFIYDNFEKINWLTELEENEIDSIDKKTRLRFLKNLKKEEFFVRKWLVIPAYYREERADTLSLGDQLNGMYKDLISSTRSMRMGFSFDIFGDVTRLKIQELLLKIYKVTMGPVNGKSFDIKSGEFKGNSKNSLLKRHLIGKTIDYGAYTVIVAPLISDSKSPERTPVPFGYAGITLISCVGLFKPFFVHELSEILNDLLYKFAEGNKKNIKNIDLNQYTSNEIERIISRFIKSSSERFYPITCEYTDINGEESVGCYILREYKSEADARADRPSTVRVITYADLFYISAMNIVKNKHVLITRHPITNNKNIYPARVLVKSTSRTRDIYIGIPGLDDRNVNYTYTHYNEYPYILPMAYQLSSNDSSDPDLDFANEIFTKEKKYPDAYYEFIGTTIIGNTVLKSLGADYDGDCIFIRGLFSVQANEEAEKIIYAKSNILGANGTPIRGLSKVGKDCVVSLYEFTKE